jgi:hypothetical protein
MKTLLALPIVLAAAMAFAEEPPQPAAPANPPATSQSGAAKKSKAGAYKFSGKVDSVDASSNKLTVAGKKHKTMDFTIPGDAKVLRNGKKAALGDIKKGDQAVVVYTGSADNPSVQLVAAKNNHGGKKKKGGQ